jgi:signal transduction histidine kinase
MTQAATTGFGDLIGARIQEEHRSLSVRWFERLRSFLPVAAHDVFPTESLLDHIPALFHEIGAYLRAPEQDEIAANTLVIAKARELGLLRHEQRASVHQLLREYDLLARILEAFVAEELMRLDTTPSPVDGIDVMARVNRAVRILMQTTIDTFASEYTSTIAAQTERLESFNRMVSHELRNPLSTLQYALEAMDAADLSDEQIRKRLLTVSTRNVSRMTELIQKLEQLSRAGAGDSPTVQRVEVTAVAREAARQLRDMADSRRVHFVIADNLPVVEVDVARLELVLVNLFSNGIKYSDPAKPERLVEVIAGNPPDNARVTVVVRDNGIGIPAEAHEVVFDQFVRAHGGRGAESSHDGIGLGLSIVRECMKALGGSVRLESQEGVGTSFHLTLPRAGEPAPSG